MTCLVRGPQSPPAAQRCGTQGGDVPKRDQHEKRNRRLSRIQAAGPHAPRGRMSPSEEPHRVALESRGSLLPWPWCLSYHATSVSPSSTLRNAAGKRQELRGRPCGNHAFKRRGLLAAALHRGSSNLVPGPICADAGEDGTRETAKHSTLTSQGRPRIGTSAVVPSATTHCPSSTITPKASQRPAMPCRVPSILYRNPLEKRRLAHVAERVQGRGTAGLEKRCLGLKFHLQLLLSR